MRVRVIDSIMGSGKTQKSIEIMNKSDKRFIYITPYLSEVKRIKDKVTTKRFYEPKQLGKGKMSSLKELIRDGEKINIYIPSKRMRELLINWIEN